MDTRTESAPIEIAELVEDAIFWFEQRLEALNDIVESKGVVVLASNADDENKIELDEKQSAAFRTGVSTAIRIIGKFPLSLDRPTRSFDFNDETDD